MNKSTHDTAAPSQLAINGGMSSLLAGNTAPPEQLAINGGAPTRQNMLPYGQQWIGEDDIDEVIAALRSDFITQGPKIAEFEQATADYVGAKYAVAFCNGTAALHGACFAAGIGPGDEVITSPMTFLASSNCVLYQGAAPVFADIHPATYNIDPADIARKITSRTKVLIPVDFTGQPAEMDRITDLARQHHLIVIEDSAHSLGSQYKGRYAGSLADMTMFSFHPVKHITTAEGGMIVTDNELFYHKMLLFRSHGMTKDPELLHRNEGPWYYEMQALGYNYRMTDLQAALGVAQMKKLPAFVERRRDIADQYNKVFSQLSGLIPPYQHPGAHSSWHLYVLRFDLAQFNTGRKQIFEALRAENIGVHVHYIPVYYQPYYQQIGYSKGLCPVAEATYEEIISIPLFPRMNRQDVQDVIAAVQKVHTHYSKISV